MRYACPLCVTRRTEAVDVKQVSTMKLIATFHARLRDARVLDSVHNDVPLFLVLLHFL